jgi:hypothetical protein
MKTETIAKTCHEVNRAYCRAIGDFSQDSWELCPDWQTESAIAGVEFKLANLEATPTDMHNSWMNAKIADGWVYGKVKCAKAKIHPCILPYAALSSEQQVKDYLFSAVVASLADVS